MRQLKARTRGSLMKEAKALGLPVSSSMTRDDLVQSIMSVASVITNDLDDVRAIDVDEQTIAPSVDSPAVAEPIVGTARGHAVVAGTYRFVCGAIVAGKVVRMGDVAILNLNDATALSAQGAIEFVSAST